MPSFEEQKISLLNSIKMLALKHNRDYYVSLIPWIESSTPDDTDLIEMYYEAIEHNMMYLFQSRRALSSVEKISLLI